MNDNQQIQILENWTRLECASSKVGETTIKESIEMWLDEGGYAKTTKQIYRRPIFKFFKNNSLLDNKLSLLDPKKIAMPVLRKEITDFLLAYSNHNSRRTVKAALSSFFHYLVEAWGYPKNPVPRKIGTFTQEKSNTKSLSEKDLTKLLKKLKWESDLGYKEHLTYALVLTLSHTSLRISEALQATVNHVRAGRLEVTAKRGKKRGINIPEYPRQELLEFINKYKLEGCLFGKIRNRNKSICRYYACHFVKQATGISPHGFRKSVIEILLNNRVPITDVAKVSGHKSLEMVNYYDSRDVEPKAHSMLSTLLV